MPPVEHPKKMDHVIPEVVQRPTALPLHREAVLIVEGKPRIGGWRLQESSKHHKTSMNG